MTNHWLDDFESERDRLYDLSLYQNELFKAIEERIIVVNSLKAINYRIEKLKLKIEENS